MNDDLLTSYLNDHLAGATGAIEMTEHFHSRFTDGALALSVAGLLDEIKEDRESLRDVMRQVGAKESATKTAAAWLTEKFQRLNLGPSSPERLAYARLQYLEALLVGVRGKLALWESLEAIADPRLDGVDLDLADLRRRAEAQLGRIERYRIEAARQAFGAG